MCPIARRKIRRSTAAFCVAVVFLTPPSAASAAARQTPLERASGDVLTSHQEMMTFLGELQSETQNLTIETIGRSVEGRPIVLLRFGSPSPAGSAARDKIKVFIFAQQHGDEPSGKEAAIALARDIAAGTFTAFLDKVDLLLVPQVNPDGSEKRQRRNANGADLNRQHLTLSEPELVAIHTVFQKHMPEATLDVHEYGSAGRAWAESDMEKNFGQQIGALSNFNASIALRRFAWSRVIPDLASRLEPRDVSLQRYLVVGDPNERFRYSTAALNDGRNSMGIYHSLSFITEGQKQATVEGNIHERARQQLETMKAFIDFFAANANEVKQLVESQRELLTSDRLPRSVSIVMDYAKDPASPGLTVSVKNLRTGRLEDRTFENFYPLVKSIKSVQRPWAYVIPPHATALVQVFERHRIQIAKIDEPLRAALESYRISGVKLADIEDKEALDVDVIVSRRIGTIPAGHLLVRTNQIQTNLIVTLLEPQSQFGLAQLEEFSSLLRVGSEYPVLRLMRTIQPGKQPE